jgi:tetratricopeptide (TPR) repeat protein
MAGRGLWVALLALAAAAPARGYPAGRDSLDDYNAAIALYNQGIAFANHGELAKALVWFRRARATAPDDSLRADTDRRIGETTGRLRVHEGVALFDAGNLAAARRKFTAALGYPIGADEKAYARRFIREIDDIGRGPK